MYLDYFVSFNAPFSFRVEDKKISLVWLSRWLCARGQGASVLSEKNQSLERQTNLPPFYLQSCNNSAYCSKNYIFHNKINLLALFCSISVHYISVSVPLSANFLRIFSYRVCCTFLFYPVLGIFVFLIYLHSLNVITY